MTVRAKKRSPMLETSPRNLAPLNHDIFNHGLLDIKAGNSFQLVFNPEPETLTVGLGAR